jgi:hypothetical protein
MLAASPALPLLRNPLQCNISFATGVDLSNMVNFEASIIRQILSKPARLFASYCRERIFAVFADGPWLGTGPANR